MGTIHSLPVESARVLPHTHHSGPIGSGHRDTVIRLALSPVARAVTALVRWTERYRTRQELLALTERELRDIGITRGQARAEADKTFRWF